MLVYIIGITIVFDSSINDLIVFTYLLYILTLILNIL